MGTSSAVSGQADPPNILFIAVDDLKPILACYGDTMAVSKAELDLNGFLLNASGYHSQSGHMEIESDTVLVYRMKPTHADIKFWLEENEHPLTMVSVRIGEEEIITSSLGLAKFTNLPTEISYHYIIEKDAYFSVEDQVYLFMDTVFQIQLQKLNTLVSSSEKPGFIFWPNPAKDHLNVSLSNGSRPVQIRMVNVLGSQVSEIELTGQNNYQTIGIR